MQCSNHKERNAGFTLIEMLIVIPFVMLVISAMVVGITVLVTESLQVRVRVESANEIQSSLNLLEPNIVRAMAFPTNTGALTSGQGSNNATAQFVSAANVNSSVLILRVPATDKSPLDGTRVILNATGTGYNSCASGNSSSNPAYPITYVYFLSGGTLYERTIITNSLGYDQKAPCNGTSVGTIWQRPTCAVNITGTECTSTDAVLASNISVFKTLYLNKTGAAIANQADPSTATGVSVTLTSSITAAGRTLNNSMSLTSQSSNL
jgi:type II secretory pathway component PulJ